MPYRYLSVFVTFQGAVQVDDGAHHANYSTLAAYAAVLNASASAQRMIGIFNRLGADGWQLVAIDRSPDGELYVFSHVS
ncbi:hypothetical protein [Deinococcus arenicola]|uniref:DUF4177 domain-containing protein n=1 Tax=Deinococcus arenicola TaxID=2994950 RepID=A0ABU4DPX7_9DEIO|nr:hypothetical protein [Deinococcus sp. ZS9-10]MDV6374486.1 hypothetical protein [Deinococcus sp. ZS9-10]